MFTGQKTVPLIKTLVLNLYANLYSGSRRMTPPNKYSIEFCFFADFFTTNLAPFGGSGFR